MCKSRWGVDFNRSIIASALKLRNENNLKVKQPLGKAYVINSDKNTLDAIRQYKTLIEEELNIKEVKFVDNLSEYMNLFNEDLKKTKKREIEPYEHIKDSYPKYIVTLDELSSGNINGIKLVYLPDFLTQENL